MSEMFENYNFSIAKYLNNENNLEKLNKINKYLNFALKATILKQNNNYNINEQKKCGKQILLNYILGDEFAFTKELNIRSNIVFINKKNIIDLLIKSSIELDCYNRNVLNISNDNLCNNIVKDICNGKYEYIKTFILNNNYVLKEIINNYIELKYQKDNIFNSRLELVCQIDYLTSISLKQLDLEINSYLKRKECKH